MDRTVGGPLIPTVLLNNVLNQETVVQHSHLHTHMPVVYVPLHTLLNYHVCIQYVYRILWTVGMHAFKYACEPV